MPVSSQSTARYASLGGLLENCASGLSAMRICIVTPDLLGPVKNGGIGTACYYLAYALAEAGHEVSVLFTSNDSENGGEWQKDYEKRGIKVFPPEKPDAGGYFPDYPPLVMALKTYEWLASRPDFELIIFMEWQANGFYALHAKKCGLRFQNTALVVVIHSPSIWHCLNNAAAPANPIQSCAWHMERQCMAMADAAISPSAYMLDWCLAHGFRLPELALVQPNLLAWPETLASRHNAPIGEIVFFGRLEYRKGLAQFCAALDILAKRGHLPARVTFLGKCALMGDEHCLLYIARRSKNWKKCEIQLILHYDHSQAVEYLCGKKRLAVMPSVADNSPYTVYECLAAGIPFLARKVGGAGELVAEQDRDAVLFSDNPRDLADRLEHCLGKKPYRAKLNFNLRKNREAWIAGLPALAAKINLEGKVPESGEHPFISVCLTHYNRPHLLEQAVDSLLAQDYQNFEVILADDGSTSLEARLRLKKLEPVFNKRGWRILRLENGYVGRARNIAAREAKGDWLLFFDDDNVAKPEMLRLCARAAASCASGLIAVMFEVFAGNGRPDTENRRERFLPTGGLIAYSAIHNTLADATALVSRKTFERMAGFTEDYGLGHEDFELYLRMALAGEPVAVIPEPLFWYRRNESENSMLQNTNAAANRMRSLRPFVENLPAPLGELALMAHGMATELGFYRRANKENPVDKDSLKIQGDPQSDANLELVAAFLEKKDHAELAFQVLDCLAANESGRMFARETIKILDACRKQNLLEAKLLLASYEQSLAQLPESESIAQRDRLYADMLKRLPQNSHCSGLRLELARALARDSGNDIARNLLAASELAESDSEAALICFFRALTEAERQYLAARPDVAEAVRNGDFVCGLHHYALHGKKDGAVWPAISAFSRALKDMASEFELIFQAHGSAYKHNDMELAKRMFSSLNGI